MLVPLQYDKKTNKRTKSFCFINQAVGEKNKKHQNVIAEFADKLLWDERPN
jgi:hypothetical protein